MDTKVKSYKAMTQNGLTKKMEKDIQEMQKQGYKVINTSYSQADAFAWHRAIVTFEKQA